MKKYIKVSLWIVSFLTTVFGVSLFVYSFNNASPLFNNISQGEVLNETKYSRGDSALVRQLKDNALSDWIATRDTTKLLSLSSNKKLIEDIEKGLIPVGELQEKLNILAKSLNATEYEITQLEARYELASLDKNLQKLNDSFNTARLSEFSSQQKVIRDGNLLLENLKSASDIWLKSEEVDSTLLNKINIGIDTLSGIQEQFLTVSEYSNAIASPTTLTSTKLSSFELIEPFSIQLSNNYGQMSKFVTDNVDIMNQKQRIEDLKQKMRNTAVVPNFVGKTVSQVKEEVIQYNKIYKSTIELRIVGDAEDDEGVIISQNPSPDDFDLMKKDSTVSVRVPDKAKSVPSSKEEAKPLEEKSITKESSDSTQESEEVKHVEGSSDGSSTIHVDR